MSYTFEYCHLCKREVHDWRTHVKSSEHQRNSLAKVKEREAAANKGLTTT